MKLVIAGMLAAGLMLSACATSPGRGGDEGALMGAKARAKNGPDPTVAPPPHVGENEDPVSNTPQL